MNRRITRWLVEAGVIAALAIGLTWLNSFRECVTPTFGLPVNCSSGWVVAVTVAAVVVVVIVEFAAAVFADERRDRP